MANIQKSNSEVTKFIEFLHKSEIVPFLEDIYLITVDVAGLHYIENIDEIIPKIKEKSNLELVREKNNKFDANAILVLFNGEKIGYVPREHNLILANLMDAGKEIYGVVKTVSAESVYENDDSKIISFKIFLKE
ncbi:HIRAN domain-containing protein [Methanobrevibacter sp.]|uniref:HIRAN domain-containing protein n=1 Tax=Methanobrevibacter sp. TaxID=66852 RepID=UPI0026DF37F8|nr:HIRAN domain-containing protein [Methanobrevibacter sp.]MDO5823378.1 HIRAN domain-containing protein [Methanobrevibacter sp.]